jgi:Flp pilus assembly protein TadG
MQNIQHCLKDERGTITIVFALSLVAMTIAMGLAIDYSRALAFYDRTQSALDATSLSTAKAMAGGEASDAELKQLAQSYFEQSVRSQGHLQGKYSRLNVSIDRTTSSAIVTVDAIVDTVLGRLVGIDDMKQDLTSTSISSGKDVELGVMLDVSGSMEGDKLKALKAAGKDLVDTILTHGPSARTARIGLVPYSTAVNAGQYAVKARGNSSKAPKLNNGHWQDACVSERKGAHAFTSASPANGRVFGSKASDCPDNAIVAMTDDRDVLIGALDKLDADGSTAGHLGAAWAWYMVSQNWQDFWPEVSAPKEADPKKLVKAVILMTDGMFNKEYEKADNGRSAKQAEKLCASMKEEGITVFTVAFDAPDDVLPLFSQCATSQAFAFNAKDGTGLRKSFAKISQHLNDLRVAN